MIHFSFLRIEFGEKILNPLLVMYYFVHCGSYECGIIVRLVSLDPAWGDLGFLQVSIDFVGDLFYSGFSCFSLLAARKGSPVLWFQLYFCFYFW